MVLFVYLFDVLLFSYFLFFFSIVLKQEKNKQQQQDKNQFTNKYTFVLSLVNKIRIHFIHLYRKV